MESGTRLLHTYLRIYAAIYLKYMHLPHNAHIWPSPLYQEFVQCTSEFGESLRLTTMGAPLTEHRGDTYSAIGSTESHVLTTCHLRQVSCITSFRESTQIREEVGINSCSTKFLNGGFAGYFLCSHIASSS